MLREDLADHDIQCKIATTAKIVIVANAIGPAKTRSELIPYLVDYVSTSPDDEVLAKIGDELANLAPLAGEKTAVLLPLEILCKAEETLVREASVRAMCKVIGIMSSSEVEEQVIPLLGKLAGEAWWTSRVSAAGIFAAAYPKITGAAKAQLRANFFQLSKDDTPMVRRAMASNIGKMFQAVEPELVDKEVVPAFNRLNNDDQDTVRILVVDSAVQLCSTVSSKAQLTEHIYPLLTKFSTDPSWRVRIQLCKNFNQLCGNLDSAILLPFYISALGDSEPDVRRIAATQLSAVGTAVGDPALLESAGLFEKIEPLVDEGLQNVKTEIAHELAKLAKIVGKAVTCSRILPLTAKLMTDELPEVRIAVMEDLTTLVKVAGSDNASAIIPFAELGRDSAWRVRYALVQATPMLGEQMGRKDFEKNLMWLIVECMQDDVFCVRDMAFQALAELHAALGAEFTESVTVPKILAIAGEKSYLIRQMSAHAVLHLLNCGGVDTKLMMQTVPCMLEMATDKVPNVATVACTALGGLVGVVDAATVSSQIKPVVADLASHTDPEVAKICSEVLSKCG